jgi:hypothetical protein
MEVWYEDIMSHERISFSWAEESFGVKESSESITVLPPSPPPSYPPNPPHLAPHTIPVTLSVAMSVWPCVAAPSYSYQLS